MVQATTILLETLKKSLKQTQSLDDDDLQRLLRSATQEALRFLNRRELPTLPLEYPVAYDTEQCDPPALATEEKPSSEDEVAPDVENAIILLAKADYEGDPEKRKALRSAAEDLLTPYRVGWGC